MNCINQSLKNRYNLSDTDLIKLDDIHLDQGSESKEDVNLHLIEEFCLILSQCIYEGTFYNPRVSSSRRYNAKILWYFKIDLWKHH